MNNGPLPPPTPSQVTKTKRLVTWPLLVLGSVLVSVGLTLAWWFSEPPLVSPLTKVPIFRFLAEDEPQSSSDKVVYGFLPYWQLNEVQVQPELTHMAYFGLTLAGDGSILTRVDGGGEPGYARMQSETLLDLNQALTDRGGKLELVLVQFNNDDIVQLISSPAAHQRTLASLDSLLLAYPIHGINIDIEYTGTVTPELRQNFTQYMKTIREHLNEKYSHVQLSVDVYASTSSNTHLIAIDDVGELVDYVVVMAYDFHRRSSPVAGPVAPLFGGKELWDSDINQHLQEFVRLVPSEKILLGVPFYGYEWQTISRDAQSHTFPDTGATASFKRVQTLLARKEELKVEERWSEEALSPYLVYEEDGETYVVYYENSRSLSYKLDYVNQLNLGGIAIWALGYDGDSRELWDVIARKL